MSKKNRNTNVPSHTESLFFSSLENELFSSITEELLTNVVKSFVIYKEVDEKRSQIDDIYGEARKIVFKEPIILYCLVEEVEPSIDDEFGGMRQIKNINLWIHKRFLEENKIKIHEGSYVEWGGYNYKIISALDTRHIHGIATIRDTIRAECVLSNESIELNI